MKPHIQRLDRIATVRNSGMSLVEVMVGITLATFGFIGIATLTIANERSQVSATDDAIVRNALRNQAERVRGTPFEDVLDTYQAFSFTVDGVNGTGMITVYTDETESSTEVDPLGLPRDLDGDGSASNTDITNNYMLLPIRINVSWQTNAGSVTSSLYLLLSSEN